MNFYGKKGCHIKIGFKLMIFKRSIFINIILIIWPFIFYLPLTSGFIAMGNDFDLIYYSYKKYIFEFWQEGQIPFWSPSEGAGFTLIYNPFAQFFYLPSWILFLICDLKNTFSLNDYLIFTLFGVSIYSFGQYQWLKNLKISSNQINFIITLLVPMGLIVSNFLRLPNAIHTFCWIPYLLLGINYSFKEGKLLKSFLLLFFSSLFILTAGYPYFIIYILILSLIYFFLIFSLNEKKIYNLPSCIFKCFLPTSISLLISSPWLYGVFKTLSFTQDRNLKSLEYATSHKFDYLDIVGSWIYPITSNTEGRYYFGIFFTFLILNYLLFFFLKKFALKKNEIKVTVYLLISFFIISFLSISDQTLLFKFIWNKIDFIQNMRTWPRINILLVPVLSLLGVLALKNFISSFKNTNLKNNNLNLINAFLIIILLCQIILFSIESIDSYWFSWHEKRFLFAKKYFDFPLDTFVMMVDGRINIISTILLIIFINYIFKFSKNLNFQKKKLYLFISIILLTSFEQFTNANLQWGLDKWKTPNTESKYSALKNLNDNFNKPRIKTIVHGNNYFRDDAFTINNFLNWGNKNHNILFWKYYDKHGTLNSYLNYRDTKNLEMFFGLNDDNKKIFFSDNILYKNPISFVEDSLNFEKQHITRVNILNFTNNSITIQFISNIDGWLSYIDNFDPFWTAKLNDRNIKLYKLMNTYKSIEFNSGENIIIFKYEPFNFKKKYFNFYSSL